MANIDPEIRAFQSAVYGEEVRSSMVSLAQKLNKEVTDAAEEVDDWLSNHAADSIEGWLDDHPEATTTVVDGSITAQKINNTFLGNITNSYITVDALKEKGDTDDTNAFKKAFSLLADSDVIHLTGNTLYEISAPVRIVKPIRLVGAPNAMIKFVDTGCFVITDPIYDSALTYSDGDCCVNPPNASDTTVVYQMVEGDWTATEVSAKDVKGSDYNGATSIFESVVFAKSAKCFTGYIRYLYFADCKFYNCNTVFYCEGETDNKKAEWFGKIDFVNCDIRYNRELFYLSDAHFNTNYTLSLNAVNISGGTINNCNFFLQSSNHNRHEKFRVESFNVVGCDIEHTDFFLAVLGTISSDNRDYHYDQWNTSRVPWIGGLYLYNVTFQNCHFEQFAFINHGYEGSSLGFKRSQVTFENCYMQLEDHRLIDCSDTAAMAEGNYSETSFQISIINCPMTITARKTGTSRVVGSDNYLVDQLSFPVVRVKHPRYSVHIASPQYNTLVKTYDATVPVTSGTYKLSRSQLFAMTQSSITNDTVGDIARILVQPLTFKADINLDVLVINQTYDQIKGNLMAASLENQQSVLTSLVTHTSTTDSSFYWQSSTADQFVDAVDVSVDTYTFPLAGEKAYFQDNILHTIGKAGRGQTSYIAALNDYAFLRQIPNGTLLSFVSPAYASDIYYVINSGYVTQLLQLASTRDSMTYLAMTPLYATVDMRYRTEFRNCTALKRVDIQYTPTTDVDNNLPRELFLDSTALTDIFVPWSSEAGTSSGQLNHNAPWTNTSGVKVHFADDGKTYIYTDYGVRTLQS